MYVLITTEYQSQKTFVYCQDLRPFKRLCLRVYDKYFIPSKV